MIGLQTRVQSPVPAKKFFNGKKWRGLTVRILQLTNSIFKYLFEPKNLFAAVRAEEKEKKSLRVSQSRRKRETTHHSARNRSSSSRRKTRRGEKERRKRQRHHSKHQSYVCVAPSNNIVNTKIVILTLLLLNWKIQTLEGQKEMVHYGLSTIKKISFWQTSEMAVYCGTWYIRWTTNNECIFKDFAVFFCRRVSV